MWIFNSCIECYLFYKMYLTQSLHWSDTFSFKIPNVTYCAIIRVQLKWNNVPNNLHRHVKHVYWNFSCLTTLMNVVTELTNYS